MEKKPATDVQIRDLSKFTGIPENTIHKMNMDYDKISKTINSVIHHTEGRKQTMNRLHKLEDEINGNKKINSHGEKTKSMEIDRDTEKKILEEEKLLKTPYPRSNEKNLGNKDENIKNQFFMLVGPWNNWEASLGYDSHLWGIKENDKSTIGVYEKLKQGDIVFFYQNKDEPKKFTKTGIFGVGRVVRKFRGDKQYWPDEIKNNKIIYPLRFEFEIIHKVNYDNALISWIYGLPNIKGLNSIVNPEKLFQLLEEVKMVWELDFENDSTNILQQNLHSMENEAESLAKIPEFVYLGLIQKGKTINEINPNLITKGDEKQKRFSELPIWHSKKEIDKFVQKKLKLTDEQIAGIVYDDGKNKFYYSIVQVISKLRKEETLIDWVDVNDSRPGIWRITNVEEVKTRNDTDHHNFFIFTGPWKNWEQGIRQNPIIFGLTEEDKQLESYKKIKSGDIVFFYQTTEHPIYFSTRGIFGIGRVVGKKTSTAKIFPDEIQDDKIIYTDHIEIEKIKIAQSNDDVIPWIEGLTWTHAINQINEKDLVLAVCSEISSKWEIQESDLENNLERKSILERDTKTLELPSEDKLKEIKKEIKSTLLVNDAVIEKIIASLYSGKHVLLTGPVGTGKTDLAQKLPQIVWNYFPEIHTATSDWTTQDVIGGLYPKIEDDGSMKFQIQKGCVSSTVAKNWSDETGQNGVRITCTKKDSEGENHEYEGMWLVIDEFNRASIDRAFGQLFTSLEYRNELKVPTAKPSIENKGQEFDRFLIPSDYRIIGTLNTYDKHFLFQLSDALKRRFDFIEVTIPERKDYEKEFDIIKIKAADNELLKQELEILLKENMMTKTHFIEILAFIRKIKQLGTAISISILRDLLIFHKMGNTWDESLDSGLVKKIIPQLEGIPSTALIILYKFINGDLGKYFIEFPIDEHPEKVSDFKKELEKYKMYYEEKMNKDFSDDWLKLFENMELNKLKNEGSLNESEKVQRSTIQQELYPWNKIKPELKNFKKAIANMIKEDGFTDIANLESE
jgi:MoxR-like ATPase